MIVLDSGDLIEGDATNSAEVDFTIYGLDNNALKQLADGQLADAKGTIYTADSTDVVSSIILVNTGAAHNNVNLYFKASGGTSRRLIPKDLQLESGYSLHFEGGKCVILTTGGAIVETVDVSALLDDTAGGTDALTTKAPTSNVMYDHGVATSGIHGVGGSTIASAANIATHAGLTATHGAADIADISDIAVDANLSVAAQDAISKRHTQGTDVALGAVGTKNPPIDADKVIYRDSADSDALVTSTWAQVKAFLKTYFDTIYEALGSVATHAGLTETHGATGAVVGTTNTQTLTNKRITPRITTITSHATPTINTDNCDAVTITAQAEAITSMTTNLSGTPVNFQKLIFRIKDNGTLRAITWGAKFVAKGVALPTTTVAAKLLTVGFIYDTVAGTWGCVASVQEA